MLQNARVVAFTVSELLRENQYYYLQNHFERSGVVFDLHFVSSFVDVCNFGFNMTSRPEFFGYDLNVIFSY